MIRILPRKVFTTTLQNGVNFRAGSVVLLDPYHVDNPVHAHKNGVKYARLEVWNGLRVGFAHGHRWVAPTKQNALIRKLAANRQMAHAWATVVCMQGTRINKKTY